MGLMRQMGLMRNISISVVHNPATSHQLIIHRPF